MSARPVPHIDMTPGLRQALDQFAGSQAMKRAQVNPCDIEDLRSRIKNMANWFESPAFFTEGTEGDASQQELEALSQLILMATLLSEHIKAGNV